MDDSGYVVEQQQMRAGAAGDTVLKENIEHLIRSIITVSHFTLFIMAL